MKTSLLIVTFCTLLLAACNSSSKEQVQREALLMELRAQREELQQFRTQTDAERQKLHRALAAIQGCLEDVDSSLKTASAEIWGDGSPTSARLSTARHSLASVRADVDDLAMALRTSHSK
jgi:hypothetical protein